MSHYMRRRTIVAAMLVVSVFSSADVLAACPDNKSAEKGFALLSKDGKTKLHVTRILGSEVYVDSYQDANLTGSLVYRDGLHLISNKTKNGVTTVEYSPALDVLPMEVGARHTYGAITRTPVSEVMTASELKVVRRDEVKIGTCTYNVFVIERRNQFLGSQKWNLATFYYSPELKFSLRSTLHHSDGKEQEFVYQSIESDQDSK